MSYKYRKETYLCFGQKKWANFNRIPPFVHFRLQHTMGHAHAPFEPKKINSLREFTLDARYAVSVSVSCICICICMPATQVFCVYFVMKWDECLILSCTICVENTIPPNPRFCVEWQKRTTPFLFLWTGCFCTWHWEWKDILTYVHETYTPVNHERCYSPVRNNWGVPPQLGV